jgi:hypothetical protein
MVMEQSWELLPQYRQNAEWVENEAHLVNEALDTGVISLEEASRGLKTETEIAEMMQQLVRFTYFVEFPPDQVPLNQRGQALQALFNEPVINDGDVQTLAAYLGEQGHAVSLAMCSRDPATAEAIRCLNLAGVPVIGWITLPDHKGYWTNPTNLFDTAGESGEVIAWAQANGLELAGLGFDIEKPLPFVKALVTQNWQELTKQWRVYRRAAKHSRNQHGPFQTQFRQMLDNTRGQGLATEVYTFPKFMKRLMGGMDDRTADKYIEMLYMSPYGDLMIQNGVHWLRSSGAIPALGLVTADPEQTPGRDFGGELPRHLTPDEVTHQISKLLSSDFDLAARRLDLRDIYIFALNGASVALMADSSLRAAFRAASSQ